MPPLRLALISSRIYSGPSRWLPTTITPFSWKTTESIWKHVPLVSGQAFITCINSYLTAPELAYILQNSESKVLITSKAKLDIALEAVADCPMVQLVLVVGASSDDLPAGGQFASYEDAIAITLHMRSRMKCWAPRCCTHPGRQVDPRESSGRSRRKRQQSPCRSMVFC